jgi:hypothetical protein
MIDQLAHFADQSPWLFLIFFYFFFTVVGSLINRAFRTINIAVRGWPTNPLMDGDGDLPSLNKEDDT